MVYNNVRGDITMHDRGNIKWTSLMLPEHVELLQNFFDENKIEKPILSEDKLEEIQYTLEEAFHHKLALAITYFKRDKKLGVQGEIEKFNPLQQVLVLQTFDKETVQIPIQSILGAEKL